MRLQDLCDCRKYPKLTLLLADNLVEHEKLEKLVELAGMTLFKVFAVQLSLLYLLELNTLRIR